MAVCGVSVSYDPEILIHADKSPPTEALEFGSVMKKSCLPRRGGRPGCCWEVSPPRGPPNAAFGPMKPEKESAWLILLLKKYLIGWKLMTDVQERTWAVGEKPQWARGRWKCACGKCAPSLPDRSFDTSSVSEGWISLLCSCRWGKARASWPQLQLDATSLPALCPIAHSYRFQHLPAPAHASTEASTRVGCKNTHLSHPQHFNYQRVEYKADCTQHAMLKPPT